MPLPPIVTRLEHIATQAQRLRDDYDAFRYYIDLMWEREGRTDAELDALVDEIAAGVVSYIDCTACANCCRSIPVALVPDDIPALAAGTGLSPADLTAQLVDQPVAHQHGEWGIFHHSPCTFLDGTVCSLYAHRPASCRAYPAFTPDFRYLAAPIMAGAGLCPIIFNVIERLKVRLGW
ncbi:MAG: YkgJ family cysteine cluster protein [Chloroflexi bacterium]|nr:YkgJ family cysteine cluster protein [Chloroflexota bacterium]